MEWSDEPYVRLYTRDTTNWRRFGWEGQAVLSLLLRKVDRAGVLDLSGLEPWEAVALAIGMPDEVVQVGIAKLLKLGTLVVRGDQLVIPNHLAAQTATKSDKLRQRESRERRSLGTEQSVTNRDGAVTPRDTSSRETVAGHAESQSVTPRHSLLCSAVLSNAEQTQTRVGAREVSPPAEAWQAQEFASSVPTRFRKLHMARFNVDPAVGGSNVHGFPERLLNTAEAQKVEPLALLERTFAAWAEQGAPGRDKATPYSAYVARFDSLASPQVAKAGTSPQARLKELSARQRELMSAGNFGDEYESLAKQIRETQGEVDREEQRYARR